MKTPVTSALLLFAASVLLIQQPAAQTGQKAAAIPSRPAIGISAGHYRYDPGIAIEYTTRGVFQNHVALRLKGSMQWLESYKAIHYHWISYHTFSAGLVYNGKLFDRTRFYTELGILGIVPNGKFSDSGFVEGLYELNGLEMKLLEKNKYTGCLFFSIGPSFITAFAEKIEGLPRYGQGVNFIIGFRGYIGK